MGSGTEVGCAGHPANPTSHEARCGAPKLEEASRLTPVPSGFSAPKMVSCFTSHHRVHQLSSEQDRFYLARQSRRKASKLLASQQTADAQTASDIRDRVLVGQRAILNLLVDYLLGFAAEAQPADGKCRLFRQIFPDGSLDEWREYGARHRALKEKVSEKEIASRRATTAYEEKSPFGGLSRVFQDEGSKRLSLALKAEMERLRADEERLKSELAIAENGIRYFTRRFLQSANQSQNLLLLASTDCEIRYDLSNALQDLSTSLNDIWGRNAAAQLISINELKILLSQIEAQYKTVEMKRLSGGVL